MIIKWKMIQVYIKFITLSSLLWAPEFHWQIAAVYYPICNIPLCVIFLNSSSLCILLIATLPCFNCTYFATICLVTQGINLNS